MIKEISLSPSTATLKSILKHEGRTRKSPNVLLDLMIKGSNVVNATALATAENIEARQWARQYRYMLHENDTGIVPTAISIMNTGIFEDMKHLEGNGFLIEMENFKAVDANPASDRITVSYGKNYLRYSKIGNEWKIEHSFSGKKQEERIAQGIEKNQENFKDLFDRLIYQRGLLTNSGDMYHEDVNKISFIFDWSRRPKSLYIHGTFTDEESKKTENFDYKYNIRVKKEEIG